MALWGEQMMKWMRMEGKYGATAAEAALFTSAESVEVDESSN